MSISKKVILVCVTGFLLFGGLSTALSIHALNKRGQEEAAYTKRVMIEEKKAQLRDLVNSIHATIKAHYN